MNEAEQRNICTGSYKFNLTPILHKVMGIQKETIAIKYTTAKMPWAAEKSMFTAYTA